MEISDNMFIFWKIVLATAAIGLLNVFLCFRKPKAVSRMFLSVVLETECNAIRRMNIAGETAVLDNKLVGSWGVGIDGYCAIDLRIESMIEIRNDANGIWRESFEAKSDTIRLCFNEEREFIGLLPFEELPSSGEFEVGPCVLAQEEWGFGLCEIRGVCVC